MMHVLRMWRRLVHSIVRSHPWATPLRSCGIGASQAQTAFARCVSPISLRSQQNFDHSCSCMVVHLRGVFCLWVGGFDLLMPNPWGAGGAEAEDICDPQPRRPRTRASARAEEPDASATQNSPPQTQPPLHCRHSSPGGATRPRLGFGGSCSLPVCTCSQARAGRRAPQVGLARTSPWRSTRRIASRRLARALALAGRPGGRCGG